MWKISWPDRPGVASVSYAWKENFWNLNESSGTLGLSLLGFVGQRPKWKQRFLWDSGFTAMGRILESFARWLFYTASFHIRLSDTPLDKQPRGTCLDGGRNTTHPSLFSLGRVQLPTLPESLQEHWINCIVKRCSDFLLAWSASRGKTAPIHLQTCDLWQRLLNSVLLRSHYWLLS